MRILILALAASLAVTFTPTAVATAAGCAPLSPGAPVGVSLLVPPPFAVNVLGAGCLGGKAFTSTAAPCPLTLTPVALPGEYCGAVPGYLPGTTITCTGVAQLPGATFTALVLGLDAAPWTGNAGPLTFEGVYPAASHTASITVPGTLPARVIAYPVGVVPATSGVIVGCAASAPPVIDLPNPQLPPGACGTFKLNLRYADCGGTLPHGGPECSGVYEEITDSSGRVTRYVEICDTPGGGESICIGAIREPPGTWDETCIDPLGPCKIYEQGGTVEPNGNTVRRTDALGGEREAQGRTFQPTYYRCLANTQQG